MDSELGIFQKGDPIKIGSTGLYGMTAEGFKPKRLVDIINDLTNSISLIQDPKTGEFPFCNVFDDSLVQQFIAIIASEIEKCWVAAYEGSVQFDPLHNTGAGQSATVQLNGLTRKPGSPTICQFSLTANPGTVIPAGSRVGSLNGDYSFSFPEDIVFPLSGPTLIQQLANGICTSNGAYSPEAGEIGVIQTPIAGWINASNTRIISTGTPEETDEELRRRQQRSTSNTSYRQIEAIYAGVLNVPGVTYCRAYQNDDIYPEDDRGIPFKEVAVVAEGGDPEEITEVLFNRFPVGVIGYGNVTRAKYDIQGISYPISYSQPTPILIYVSMALKVTNGDILPSNYEALIKEAIIQYAHYGVGNEDGFPPGANIIISRLLTPINSVLGFGVTELKIGTSKNNLQASDIEIPWNQVGRFAEDRISITMSN